MKTIVPSNSQKISHRFLNHEGLQLTSPDFPGVILTEVILTVLQKPIQAVFENPSDQSNSYITRTEAEQILCVSKSKIYELMKDGTLPYAVFSGRRLFRLSDVHYLIESGFTAAPLTIAGGE